MSVSQKFEYVSTRKLFHYASKYTWPLRYNWNIVECGFKHNNPNPRSKYTYLYTEIKSPLKGQIGAVFQTHCRVCVLLIIGYPTVTVKCRTAIKTLFLYFNLCQCVTLNILLWSIIFITFLVSSMVLFWIRIWFIMKCEILISINKTKYA